MMRFVFFFLVFTFPPLALGETSRLQFDINATSGGILWHGMPNDQTARPYFGANAQWIAALSENFGAGFQIDYTSSTVNNRGEGFDLEREDELSVSTISFVPSVCTMGASAQACAGVGQGTVNINGSEERRDFGTWSYTAAARAYYDRLTLMAMARYVGQIEERSSGQDREMGFKSLGIGVGYSINPLTRR